MAEPTIQQVFGSGATHTATEITISKADLTSYGLTASIENTAESLLAAIFLIARAFLTQSGFDANSDQSITILPGFDSIIQRDDGSGELKSYRQNQLTINLHKLDSEGIDPDDY